LYELNLADTSAKKTWTDYTEKKKLEINSLNFLSPYPKMALFLRDNIIYLVN